MQFPQTYRNQTYRNRALYIIFGLLLIRLTALWLSPYGLHGDEAQYWAWAQDLDWGYFSKPPMIAWLIAAATAIFGDAEWAIRLTSPLLHSATSCLIFLTGRKAFSPRAGFWACAVYSLMPAVWVSSMIISTDAALLFFWALGLHAWISVRSAVSSSQIWRFSLQLGIALGLGLMSKYAMFFFIPPLIIAAIFDAPTRKALCNLKGMAAALITGLIVTPNILWNTAHEFATLSHTASNANLANKTNFFHPLEFLQFFRDQFGVFGPIPFILLLITLAGVMKLKLRPNLEVKNTLRGNTSQLFFYLSLFALTPLVIISLQAILSRANANWAVSAYPSAALLLGAAAMQFPRRKHWLNRGLLMQSLFCSFLLIVSLFPNVVDRLGVANSVKRLRAWPQTVDVIQARFAQGHNGQNFDSIVVDNRLVFYEMKYYGLEDTAPIFMWQSDLIPKNHAELTHPFTGQGRQGNKNPILLINYSDSTVGSFSQRFSRIDKLAPVNIKLGGGKTRSLKVWAAYGYNPPNKP